MPDSVPTFSIVPAERSETARWLHASNAIVRELLEDMGASGARSSYLEAVAVPGLGLAVGAQTPLQCFGTVADLIVHARTLREALVDLIQHAPAVLRCARFKLREEATHASLQYDAPLRDPIAAQFRAEVALSLALRAVRNFASSAAPSVLSLRRLAQESDRHLRETLGCEIRYDAPVNEITLQRGLLDQPNMFVDAELYELYKRHAEGRMRAENAAWHVRAKAVLRHELNLDSVDYAVVARRLSVTPRALRRRLSSEGYSLTALTNEVRREIAVEDLAMSSRPIKEIAERLGFSEVSAFHRAFRRWTHGETPARYRMAAQSALRPSS